MSKLNLTRAKFNRTCNGLPMNIFIKLSAKTPRHHTRKIKQFPPLPTFGDTDWKDDAEYELTPLHQLALLDF